jgi:hypothetical protein
MSYILEAMDIRQFWKLIEDARVRVDDAADSEAIAARAAVLLSTFPRKEIVAAQRVLGGLLAASYQNALWAAASLINGGCGDDGFDYFRGWLILQGREVFDRSLADPDSLADLPVIGSPALDRPPVECEETLYIAMRAYRAATGAELPADAFTIRYPEPDAGWYLHFDDRTQMEQRLPRLTVLCWPEGTHSLGGRFAPWTSCCLPGQRRLARPLATARCLRLPPRSGTRRARAITGGAGFPRAGAREDPAASA